MTDKINDGGPAYPWGSGIAGGLTKREAAAIAAMQGMLAADTDFERDYSNIAMLSVKQADALLAELAKGAGQ
jgi:hypothetical protein